MIVVKPHKKMCLLLILISFFTFLWGLHMIIYEGSATYMIEHIMPVPARGLGLFLIIVFIAYIGFTIWAYHTKRFILIDHSGIIVPGRKRILWDEIEKVDCFSFQVLFFPWDVLCTLYLKERQKVYIRCIALDCGVKKFANMVLYYRDNLEKRQELGSADLYVIKNS